MTYQGQKLSFKNKEDHLLDARLELPSEQVPRAYAIFVHCFTCSKNVHAASRISKSLTQLGIGVLRFDFTGLGNSDGDFSNSNFSTNVSDLVSAYEHMLTLEMVPKILIGHSLGGSAVLAAKALMPEIKGVITINAPSDLQHVELLFAQDIKDIETQGQAKVTLAGREFIIKKQFLDDLRSIDLENKIANLHAPLLIFHSPQDQVVSPDHATKIYQRASQPKNLLALAGGNHMLSNKEDTDYVADIISSWVKRYLKEMD